MALLPAAAGAATEGSEYGLDAYLACIAAAGPGTFGTVNDHVACANALALDLTDGGQVRRLPLCVRNRAVEFVNGENGDPYRTEIDCIEQYLGTSIATVQPQIALPQR